MNAHQPERAGRSAPKASSDPTPPVSTVRRRWLEQWPRLAAGAILLAQALMVAQALPPSHRWFLHPDDRAIPLFAHGVVEHGLPTVAYDNLPRANLSAWPVMAPESSHLRPDGMLVPRNPVGVYYILALPASLGPQALFATWVVLAPLCLLCFFVMAEKAFGGPAALVGLVFVAFSAPLLYWSAFPFSNYLAAGLLCLGLRLAVAGPAWARALGGVLVGATPLLRFEYILIVGMLGLGFLASDWRGLRNLERGPLAFVLGGLAGLLLFALMLLATLHTVNFLSITRAANPNDNIPLQQAIGSTDSDRFKQSLSALALIVTIPLILLVPSGLFRQRKPWPGPWLVAGVAGLMLFLLGNRFNATQVLMEQSQTRYLIPMVVVAGLGVVSLAARLRTARLELALVVAGVLIFAGMSVQLADGRDGFGGTGLYLEKAHAHDLQSRALPTDAIIIGEVPAKMVLSRPVVSPTAIPEGQRQNETVRIIGTLLDAEVPVYVSREFGAPYKAWALAAGDHLVDDPAAPLFVRVQR